MMSFWEKIRKNFDKFFKHEIFQNSSIRRGLLALGVFLSITLILTIDLFPNALNLEVGKVANKDIEAPVTTTYIDKQATEKKKKKVKESVVKAWETDPEISNQVLNDISGFFNLVREYKGSESEEIATETESQEPETEPLTIEEKVEEINNRTFLEITSSEIKVALEQSMEDLAKQERYLKELVLSYLNKGIQPSYVENVKAKLAMNIENTEFSSGVKGYLISIAEQVVKPNLVLDEEKTQRRQEKEMAEVAPVERTIQKGQKIIRAGDVVTEEDIAILEALGLMRPKIKFRTIGGLILIVMIFMAGILYYLYEYHYQIFTDESMLLLLGLISVLTLLIGKVIYTIGRVNTVGYLVPLAAASILIAILIDSSIAIFFTTVLSFLTVIVTNGDIAVGAVLLASGITGVFSVSEVSQRSDLVRAGFFVSGVAAVTIFAYSLTQSITWFEVLKLTGWGIINGIFAAIMTNGLLPYLENVFGITSAVKLLELANPNQPLLKKLLMEAPGTYHHSILVGNLVEAAADKVGANSLLARVGAYYHDIGKIKRAYFFIDNQFGGENPHDKLSPGLSTLIIKSHIKDGVEMARKHKLPKPIIDIIQQHHGTNLISFFYQEALSDDKYDNIEKDEFRYDGPKPQTREAALIMLADISEAAVRSKGFNRSNHNRIEGLVRDLIRKKLEEGQLDECDLTLKDLDEVAISFTKVLTGIYHYRVDYPENIAKEMKGVPSPNGDSNK